MTRRLSLDPPRTRRRTRSERVRARPAPRLGTLILLATACQPTGGAANTPDAHHADASPADVESADLSPSDTADDSADDTADAHEEPSTFRVMTFNTGSGARPPSSGNGGFLAPQREISDAWYGNGLAWLAVIADTQAFIAQTDPDIVVFQEIFHPGECPDIPAEFHPGFVCEDDPSGVGATVVQQLLGEGWQVMCHPQKPDKCAAVHERFGRFRGCEDALCLEGMRGAPVPECGRGARVAAAIIERVDGSALNLVNVHGTSGASREEQACRALQVAQIFEGEGAHEALVHDTYPNLILGDLNTDPGRFPDDLSAIAWNERTSPDAPFHFLTDASAESLPTYVLVSIDHVIADRLAGSCWHPGVTPDTSAVTEIRHFDHVPAVCDLWLEAAPTPPETP